MVYDNVIKICDKKGISPHKVEKLAGLGNGTIYRWQKASPTVNNLQAVADVLKVSITTLLKDE